MEELELRKAELSLATSQVSESRRRIVNAQEELRKQVAQRLHGPVQNRLLVATYWLNSAQKSVAALDPEMGEQLERTASLMKEINEKEVRGAVRELHPSLIRVSLRSSLRSLSDELLRNMNVELDLDQRDPETEELWHTGLSEELRLSIYRVAEESLNNVLKYAGASRVLIILRHPEPLTVTMTVEDNGRGFDQTETSPGFGILSMQDHCGSMGGSLEVVSEVGKGTSVVATFPLGREASPGPDRDHESYEEPGSEWGVDQGCVRTDASEKTLSGVKSGPVKVLIIDDQPDFCTLIREMLKPYKDFKVVAEGYDGPTALKLVDAVEPDAVLLDVEMPNQHGLDIAEEICRRFPTVNVILMSAYHRKEYIQEDERARGTSFIPKVEFSIQALLQACDKASPQPVLISVGSTDALHNGSTPAATTN